MKVVWYHDTAIIVVLLLQLLLLVLFLINVDHFVDVKLILLNMVAFLDFSLAVLRFGLGPVEPLDEEVFEMVVVPDR